MKSGNDITISVIEEIDMIENVRSSWESLQWYPYTDINYYINIISQHQNFISPYIILVYREEKPVSLIISRIINDKYNIKIGYKSLFSLQLKTLEILYGGILGETSNEIQQQILARIKIDFKKRKFDIAKFKYLDIKNNRFHKFSVSDDILIRSLLRVVNPHWRLRIPESFDDFVNGTSTSTQKYIKRYTKRFEKRMSGRYEIKSFTHPSDLETILIDTEAVASKTYQRALNIGVKNDKKTYNEYYYLLKNNMLNVWILYIDNKPAAFWIGISYKNVFLSSATGFDPQFKTERIGTYLLLHMIKQFCKDKEIDKMDFGFGFADYKKNFGNEVFKESSITLYSPNIKGVYLKTIMNFLKIFLIVPKQLLKNVMLVKYLKKKWREKLSQAEDKIEKAII